MVLNFIASLGIMERLIVVFGVALLAGWIVSQIAGFYFGSGKTGVGK